MVDIIRDFLDGQFGDDEREEVGIAGFTLLARTREKSNRTKDVPTTFLEDGSHVNDHQIRNPLTLSIEGNVSDIHLRPSPTVQTVVQAQAEVGNITQYAPARTQAQVSQVNALVNDFRNAADQAEAVINSGVQAANYVGLFDSSAKSNIEQFLDIMDAIYESGALVAIDMPLRTHRQMCITKIETTRDNQQNALSFVIEAQQFRFAETQFVEVEEPAANTNGQLEGETEKGLQEGEEVEQSFASSLLERFGVQ